jgi:hypothetical protein
MLFVLVNHAGHFLKKAAAPENRGRLLFNVTRTGVIEPKMVRGPVRALTPG